jgi:hypothetical protein
MDLATTSFDAYALFSAPRDMETPTRPTPPSNPRTPRPRGWSVGWWAFAFYGLVVGAFMLGVTASGRPQVVVRCSVIALAGVLALQASLLARRWPAPLVPRLAQSLTVPAVALAVSGLGALARF